MKYFMYFDVGFTTAKLRIQEGSNPSSDITDMECLMPRFPQLGTKSFNLLDRLEYSFFMPDFDFAGLECSFQKHNEIATFQSHLECHSATVGMILWKHTEYLI